MSLSSKNFTNYGSMSDNPEVIVEPYNSENINNNYDVISTNIDSINNYIRFFTSVGEQIGTDKDSHGLRDQILVRIMTSNQLVKSSQKDISKLSTLARGAHKQQKLQIQRLTSHFKDVVERNYQTQQAVLDKLRTYNLCSPDAGMESSDDQAGLLQLEECQAQKNLEFEQELLLDRQQRIKQIESQILDSNEMMKKLSELINDQGTQVDSIERQIENVSENVQLGHQEITTAANYASKARKRKIIIFGILAIILVVLIGIIIWSSSS